MYNISIDDDSVVVECRYLRHRRRRHYLRRCFHARTCVRRDQCARSSLSRIFITVFPLIKLIGYDRPRHAYSKSEAFDVVTKVEGCFASRDRSRFYICDTFFKRTPAIRRDFAFTIVCEASAIRSRARYVTIPARVYDYSTGNEVRRYTRGYPREKSIHDPPGPGFRRARLCFSQFEESPFQENDTVEIFRKIFSVYVRTHVQA